MYDGDQQARPRRHRYSNQGVATVQLLRCRYNPVYANDLVPGIHKDCIAIISTDVSYSGQEIAAIFDSPHLDIRYKILRVVGAIAIISLILVSRSLSIYSTELIWSRQNPTGGLWMARGLLP